MHSVGRRKAVVAVAVVLATFAFVSHAESVWPGDKPVRIVVPFAPGGTTDIVARLIGRYLGPALGTTIVVENRAGANGIAGTDVVARSAPDGHTLVIVAPGHASNVTLQKTLPYDTLNDFEPIMLLLRQPSLLVVHPRVPANSTEELLALARAKPGSLNYASGGSGSSQHLAGAMFADMAKLDIVHIPYKGSAPAEADLLGGQVDMMFASMVSVLPQVKEGRLRALAVSSAKRSAAVPDLPTVAESGVPDYAAEAWAGLLAPKGTPKAVVDRLNAEITRIMTLPEVKARLDGLGAEFSANTPAQFDDFIRTEITRWATVVRSAGIKAD